MISQNKCLSSCMALTWEEPAVGQNLKSFENQENGNWMKWAARCSEFLI